MWIGFWRVEVPPSPKFQDQPVRSPVEVSVNWTVRGAGPVVTSAEKSAPPPAWVGVGDTVVGIVVGTVVG